MAIIGKIREKSVLLVVIIGLALLAFILGDYQKGSAGSNDFIGSGTIYGEKIDEEKLSLMMDQVKSNDAQTAEKEGRPYDQSAQDQSANQAWNYFTMSTVLEKEYEELGIEVGTVEFDAYLYGTNGFTVLPNLAKDFSDPNGQFNPKLLQKAIDGLKNSKKAEDQKRWIDTKESFLKQRKEEKYLAILHQGVYVTKLEAEQEYLAQNEVKSVSYVLRRYSEIADEKIKVSDEELKAYFEEHKSEKKYEIKKASRDLKYFDIKLLPSKRDSADFNIELNTIKTGLINAKNDSLFIMGYTKSNVKFYSKEKRYTFKPEGNPKAQKGMTYPMSLDTVFKTASIGQVVGPYNDNGNVRIAKILDFNTKVCKVRHILISVDKGADAKKFATAQVKADSILSLLTKGNFTEMVMKFSGDPGSKEKGGVYEDFMDGEMVPEFSKFSTEMPIGKIGTVKTEFGIHIIEVLGRTEVKYPVLAFIEKTLEPSEESTGDVENKAFNLLLKLDAKISVISDNLKKGVMFDTIASKAKYNSLTLSIEENKPTFTTRINSSIAEDKLLAVAFGAESVVGTLCPVAIKDKDRYIIAMLSAIHLKGVPTFEDVSEKMKVEIIKDKKSKILMAQMVKKSLEVCAKKGNTKVEKAELNFANPSLGNAGPEPEIVGAIFSGSLKKGVRSLPLKGDGGVYVVRIDNSKKSPTAIKYEEEVKRMLGTLKSSLDSAIKMALLNKADVVDNRAFSRAGVRQ